MSNSVIGSARFYFSTLTSTNRFATQLLSKTRPRAGTVISADFQTHGEGQYGRSWFGTKGKNLYVSVILYPQLEASQQFRISALAALAVRETITAMTGEEASIKWPNDIYLDNHKVAGILIRNALSGNKIEHSVVGIGINLNESTFPGDLINPTSISNVTGRTIDLQYAREILIENMNTFYGSTLTSDIRFVRKAYDAHLYRRGQNARFEVVGDGSILGGTIEGIDQYGRLLIRQVDQVQPYTLNEIRFLK